MKKALYGIFAIAALAATSVYAAPVQVGEAAGSAATSVSAVSFSATSISTVGSAVGVYTSITNVSPQQYGEGDFTKAVYVSVPLDLFTSDPQLRGNWLDAADA